MARPCVRAEAKTSFARAPDSDPDVDSEESVLGYGISLIILNVGMYFIAPAIVIVGIKKKF